MAINIGKGSFRGFGVSTNKSNADSFTVDMETIDEDQPKYQVIIRNLQTISDHLTRMNLLVEKVDTQQDSQSVRNDMTNVQTTINKLIKITSDVFKAYSKEPPTGEKEEKEWKVQSQRLKESFHDILSRYSELQKVARVKQRTSLRQSMNASGLQHVEINAEGELVAQDGHQLQVEIVKTEVDIDLIKEREAQLKQLERDIVDIHQIFKDLAILVEEQGEDIDAIENNVVNAAEHIEEGVKELEQAVEYQSSSRRKMIFIGLIVLGIVVVIIVIIVVATQPSKK